MKIYLCDLCEKKFDSKAGSYQAYSATVELRDFGGINRKVRLEVTRLTDAEEPDTWNKPEICDNCFKRAMRAAIGAGNFQ